MHPLLRKMLDPPLPRPYNKSVYVKMILLLYTQGSGDTPTSSPGRFSLLSGRIHHPRPGPFPAPPAQKGKAPWGRGWRYTGGKITQILSSRYVSQAVSQLEFALEIKKSSFSGIKRTNKASSECYCYYVYWP